jgi:hypothetical protein
LRLSWKDKKLDMCGFQEGGVGPGRRGIRWNNLSLDDSPDLGMMVKDRIVKSITTMLRADLEEAVKKLSNLEAGRQPTMDGKAQCSKLKFSNKG